MIFHQSDSDEKSAVRQNWVWLTRLDDDDDSDDNDGDGYDGDSDDGNDKDDAIDDHDGYVARHSDILSNLRHRSSSSQTEHRTQWCSIFTYSKCSNIYVNLTNNEHMVSGLNIRPQISVGVSMIRQMRAQTALVQRQ